MRAFSLERRGLGRGCCVGARLSTATGENSQGDCGGCYLLGHLIRHACHRMISASVS